MSVTARAYIGYGFLLSAEDYHNLDVKLRETYEDYGYIITTNNYDEADNSLRFCGIVCEVIDVSCLGFTPIDIEKYKKDISGENYGTFLKVVNKLQLINRLKNCSFYLFSSWR